MDITEPADLDIALTSASPSSAERLDNDFFAAKGCV